MVFPRPETLPEFGLVEIDDFDVESLVIHQVVVVAVVVVDLVALQKDEHVDEFLELHHYYIKKFLKVVCIVELRKLILQFLLEDVGSHGEVRFDLFFLVPLLGSESLELVVWNFNDDLVQNHDVLDQEVLDLLIILILFLEFLQLDVELQLRKLGGNWHLLDR